MTKLATVATLLGFFAIIKGDCSFPSEWSGKWFQSGVPTSLRINATHIESKGKCVESDKDKFLMHDTSDDCYRCVVINQKHASVLQYKETYCDPKATLAEICSAIDGDAPLFSMFRVYPPPEPVSCPFKGAPFTLSYNRGSGDCVNPPSRVESCTDDSRLVLKYQACADVRATESTDEQLICLATWKEGSTRYMVGKILQQTRRSLADEDQYRCFVYEKVTHANGRTVTYNIAQSGDATCFGLQSPLEGSRTMKLTTIDDHHSRCRFPEWLTEHHTWHSLDHRYTYRFSQRNATLKVKIDDVSVPYHHRHGASYASNLGMNSAQFSDGDDFYQAEPLAAAALSGGVVTNGATLDSGSYLHAARSGNREVRFVCHGILVQETQGKKKVQIVAHVTSGCKSGHVCMVFHKRDSNVIEVQQSNSYTENPDEACRNFDELNTPYTTLITTSLPVNKCPHMGRYSVVNNFMNDVNERRKRRQASGLDSLKAANEECVASSFVSLSTGCSSGTSVSSNAANELRFSCSANLPHSVSAYSCHGSWEDEDGSTYLITSPVARKSIDPFRYCYVFKELVDGDARSDVASNSEKLNSHSSSRYSGISTINRGNAAKSAATHASDSNPNGAQVKKFLVTAIADNCHRGALKNVSIHSWSLNLVFNGSCSKTSSGSRLRVSAQWTTLMFSAILTSLLVAVTVLR